MSIALSVPGISVNDIPIAIVPNSLKFKTGQGETVVRSASAGGGSVESVHTENAEDRIGMVSFDMFVNQESLSAYYAWKPNIGGNFVSAVQLGFPPIALSGASLTNDPDFEASADGKVTFEFKGNQVTAVF